MIARRALRAIRLSLRFARFELAFVGILILLLATAALVCARQLEALAPPAICFEPWEVAPPTGCDEASRAFYDLQNSVMGPLITLLVGVPMLAAVLIGVTLVAREVERGTARLAWSLSTSRIRWFVARLLPTLALFAGIALIAGVAADQLEGAVRPGMDVANSFDTFGNRGVILAARAVFIMAIAVAVGAVMGRVLPAVLVTAVVAVIGISGGSTVHQSILRSEAIPMEDFDWSAGDLYVDQRFKLPDGSLVSWEYFEGGEVPHDSDGVGIYPEVIVAVPGERYGFAQIRETGALFAGSMAFLLLGLIVTDRRRPD